MQPTNPHTQPTRFLATRLAALAIAAPWRRTARLATLAIGLGGFVATAQATLLVYEPFELTVGATLNGQSGGADSLGMTGSWTAGNTGSGIFATPAGFGVCDATTLTWWNGTLTSMVSHGAFCGSPAPAAASPQVYNGNNPDHEWAWRQLDPAVKANFTLGSTTWMSFVTAIDFKNNGNGTGGEFGIGSRYFSNDTRGDSMNGGSGTSIGIGIDPIPPNTLSRYYKAASWSPGIAYGTGTGTLQSYNDLAAHICIAKIVWGDVSNPTTITVGAFPDGTVLSEAAFDALATKTTLSVTVDPSTFDYISLGGARCNYDELRLGTTFNDAIGVVAVSYGNYWAPDTNGGGAGTWAAGSNVWAGAPSTAGTLAQTPDGTLVFSGTPGTGIVTVNGTVSAAAGLHFQADGYDVVPGTSAQLSLTGANAAANLITVDTGKTATLGVDVIGSTGLSKNGTGRLVLSNVANGYSGGTILNVGTLQIAALGSLGSGTVSFGGGTLQYPAGSGTSALDVSGKLDVVASGQAAMIDTNGYDVTFATAISGGGGLTKLGAGSLTLGASLGSLTGAVTASVGTLNASSASGTIATLNVPTGGTANLNSGATITTLNVSGGTASVASGVTAGSLVTTGGALSASAANPLSVSNSATFNGITISRSGVNPMTISGTNIAAPTTVDRATISASGGELGVAVQGLDIGIGKGSPGSPALPATATFLGSGSWTMSGGQTQDIGNTSYGNDNHSFHYIEVPSGDFDIIVHVTGSAHAGAGLMARDSLTSRYDSSSGAWAGIWNSGQSGTCINGSMSLSGVSTGSTPWLRVKKVGNVVTTYHGSNGVDYTQGQQLDFSAHPWSATTCYVGLDLINTSVALPASASFSEVNFMGTASIPEMRVAEFKLTTGAQMNLAYSGTMRIGGLSIDGVPQADGTYGSSSASPTPGTIDDVHFAGTGTVQLGKITPIITWSDPAAIPIGTALSVTQLNAAPSVPGALTYDPPVDTLLPLGSHTLHVDFVPTNTDSYNNASKDVTLVVEKVTPVITWDTPLPIDYGTALSDTQLSATCPVSGNMTYTPLAGTVLAAGSHTLHVDFVPIDTDTYNGASKDVTLLVNIVATPFSTWATTTNGLSGANAEFGADPDRDGLTNGIEFVVGGQPNPANVGSNSCDLLPTLALSGTNLVFTYRRTALAASESGMVIAAEYGSALSGWTPAQDGVNGVSIVTTTNGFAEGVDKVEVTLPASLTASGQLFARLHVSMP